MMKIIRMKIQHPQLKKFRSQIDAADKTIISILAKRMILSRAIGTYKRARNIEALDPKRQREILRSRARLGSAKKLPPAFVKTLFTLIHRYSLAAQKKSRKI